MIAILVVVVSIPRSAEANVDVDQTAATTTNTAAITGRFLASWHAHGAHGCASAFAPDADCTNVRGVSASGRSTSALGSGISRRR